MHDDTPAALDMFHGPLDLLLQHVEAQKLDITTISLIKVTEPFVARIRAEQRRIPAHELADFLLIAAKLIYLKSKALLPTMSEPELDAGPDLVSQLRAYQAFVQASKRLQQLMARSSGSYSRAKRLRLPQTEAQFVAPQPIEPHTLARLYREAIHRLEPMRRLPQAALERVVTIEEKIRHLSDQIQASMRLSFHQVLAAAQDRVEMVVSFLALLELIKQRTVCVEQENLFEEIYLQSNACLSPYDA